MAKKPPAATSPEVSSLPIKNDDSPLVIDLPDGQKLVINQLSNGSVIEVATWRGTGRPDSRTSRLMLGMSNSATAAAEAVQAEEAAKQQKQGWLAPVVQIANQVLAKAKSAKPAKVAKPSKNETVEVVDEVSAPQKTSFVQTLSPATTPSVDVERDDVQDWLDTIIAKSEAKVRKETAVKKAPVKTTAKKAAAKPATRKAAPKKGRTR